MLFPPVRSKPRRASAALVLLAFLPFATGCATQQMVEEYEGRILSLQEEKTQLQRELAGLRSRNSDLEGQVAEASWNTRDTSANPAVPIFDNAEITAGYNKDGLLTINIPSSITFASGSAELSSGGKQAVRSVADVLLSGHGDSQFWIEGHTDTDQPTKTKSKYPTNRDLAFARSRSVLEYLVNECKVPDSQCVVASHSEYTPVSPGASKAQNRRVEIVVHPNR